MKNKIKIQNSPEDAFINEINEGLKSDNMKKLWDKYGLFVIIFVAVVLTITVSFETIKAWRAKQNQEVSNAYAFALSLQNQGRFDESLGVLEKIKKSNHGIYANVAQVQIANLLFEQNKNDEALKVLQEVVSDKSANQQLRDISAIKLASYKLDSAPSAEIAELLQPLTANENNWSNIAKELLAMLAIRDGNINDAQKMYQEIIDSPNTQEALKVRAQDMLSLLNDNKK